MRTLLETLACALALLCLYLAFEQDSFFSDGSWLLTPRAHGDRLHMNHPLFYPLIGAVQVVLAPLGLDLFQQMSIASSAYTALGVAFAHRALVTLGLPPERRVAGALLIGLTPSVFFYATCIELPGPFFAPVGLWFWLLARCERAPSVGRAVALGLGSGVATGAHATGHLLLTIVWPWLWLRAAGPRRARGTAAVVATLAHVAAVAALLLVVKASSGHGAVKSQADLVRSFAGVDFRNLLPSLWHEWLLAMAPISVLWPFARRLWPLVAVPWLVYQTGSFLVLQRIDEHGTYMIPLVLPAAFVALHVLRGRTVWLAVALAAVLALCWNRAWARETADLPTRAQVDELTANGQALLLYADIVQTRPIVRHQPRIQTVPLWEIALAPAPYEELCARFDAAFAAQRSAGHPMLLASDCWRYVHFLDVGANGKRFLEYLHDHYLGPEQHAGGYRYHVIERR